MTNYTNTNNDNTNRNLGIGRAELLEGAQKLEDFRRRNAVVEKLGAAMLDRRAEVLQRAVQLACDSDVADWRLMMEAQNLVEHLLNVKWNLQQAVDSGELHTLYKALEEARKPPALREDELEAAETLLADLQAKEFVDIHLVSERLAGSSDYRAMDALIERMKRGQKAGMPVDDEELAKAVHASREAAQRQRDELENDIVARRGHGLLQAHSGKELGSSAPRELPYASVTGEIRVRFEPAGELVCRLPREIVETSFSVSLDSDDRPWEEPREDVAERGFAVCADLVRAARRLLDEQDEVRQISAEPSITVADSNPYKRRNHMLLEDGRMEVGMVMYLRSPHSGVEVARALCEASQLGSDIWEATGEGEGGSGNLTGPPRVCVHTHMYIYIYIYK